MDTHHLGGALLALDAIQANRRRLSLEAAEDAYYERHTPVERRIPRIASVVAVVCFGFVTIGLWLQ